MTSIRLELICDGTEDDEYLTFYQKVIQELTRSLTEFETDPRKLERLRERIARALDVRHPHR